MMISNFKIQTYFASLLFVFFTTVMAETLVDMDNFEARDVYSSGFVLTSAQELTVELNVLSARRHDQNPKLSYAWILDAGTRKLVWQADEAEQKDRDGYALTLTDRVNLKPGYYEVYYSTFPQSHSSYFWNNSSQHGFFSHIFNHDYERYSDHEYDEMYLKITGTGKALSEVEMKEYLDDLKDKSIVSLTGLADESAATQIFTVREAAEIEIYAIGEFGGKEPYDFGWITDMKSRERVWEFSYRHSDHAGGADKNRFYRGTLKLDPGTYKLTFVTDDSHSHHRWNMAPPIDPDFWGITLWPGEETSRQVVVKEPDNFTAGMIPVAEISKVRDDEFQTEGFSLSEDMDLQIFALGEGDNGEMYDYAWIVKQPEHRIVWRMKYDKTVPAGGDEKNRMFDGIVHLESGNYLVHYISDGSHAYHSWNTGAPFDKESWGVTISAAEAKLKSGAIKAYNEDEDSSYLVKMTKMRDHEKQKTRFVLDKEQNINIYAIGEGSRDEMYDYAWIEDANTGRTVWEMTYRRTDRAGGAKKNRVINDQILLPAGSYDVFYKTDSSHSFQDWNDTPPDDPGHWGITITLAAK